MHLIDREWLNKLSLNDSVRVQQLPVCSQVASLWENWESVLTYRLSNLTFFYFFKDIPPAAKNCQTEASQYKEVRGHQLESNLWPEEPATQLATGSGMPDFLRGVTAVYRSTNITDKLRGRLALKDAMLIWIAKCHFNVTMILTLS